MKTGVKQKPNFAPIAKKIISRKHPSSIDWMRLIRVRTASQLHLPLQVSFELNPQLKAQLEILISKQQPLQLAPGTLAELRSYVLLNMPSAWFHQNRVKLNSRLQQSRPLNIIFTTSYSLFPQQSPQKLIRTTIELDGKISQQIHQELWQNQEQLKQILQVHHWIIGNILNQINQPDKLHYIRARQLINFIGLVIIFLAINLTALDNIYLKFLAAGILSIAANLIFHQLIVSQLKLLLLSTIIAISSDKNSWSLFTARALWQTLAWL